MLTSPKVMAPFQRARAMAGLANELRRRRSMMAFEELDGPLVLLRGLQRAEGAEVSAPAGSRILFDREKTVLAGLELSDHRHLLYFEADFHRRRPGCLRLSGRLCSGDKRGAHRGSDEVLQPRRRAGQAQPARAQPL